jgi:hypothetical protein
MKRNKDLSILISSCDDRGDLWKIFFNLFFKYWKDCQYNVYLLSNNLKYDDIRVVPILVGDDVDWSSNLKIALGRIETGYVMFFLEDFFLSSLVNNDRIEKLFSHMKSLDATMLRLYPAPGPDKELDEFVGICTKDATFRTSLQTSIWNKEKLISLLKEGENPWEYESNSPKRVEKDDLYLSVNTLSPNDQQQYGCPIEYLFNAISNGWSKSARNHCLNCELDISESLNKRGLYGNE